MRLIKGRAERAGSVLDGKAGFDGEAGNGVRAFDAHRAPAALEVDALVAGVGDIVRIGGQFGFGLKGNHAHGRCSEALGGNRRVDGNVAAAHDHDMARKRRSVIAAHGAQELHAPQHAGQLRAFNGDPAAEAGSGGKKERLVAAPAQIAEGQVAALADAGVAAEADAEGFKPGHMRLDHGVGQAVSRDAVTEHTAGARRGLENGDGVAHAGHKTGAGKPCGAGTHHGDLGRMPDGGLFFWQVEIAEELLDGVDVYRTVNGIARAFLFAGMEADAARDAGEWVCLTEFLGGFFKLALLYEGIVAANVGPRRARRHAGRNLALVGVEAEHVEAARLEAGPASDAFVLIDNVDHVLSPWRSPRRGGRLCEG